MTHGSDLLADERRARILALLGAEGKVKTQQLIQLFDVSEDTVRRDLKDMAEQGLLRRVHGGAMPLSRTPPEAPWSARSGSDTAEKSVLVSAAVQALNPGEVVFMDSGTTNAQLARRLPRDVRFTVVTTSPEVALALCDHEHCEVILAGGRVNRQSAAVCGPEALRLVESIRADVCVLGVCAIGASSGISCAQFDEQAIKQAMVRNAGRTIALATAVKLGHSLPYRVAGAEAIATLFTTAADDEPELAAIRELGVSVRCIGAA